MLQFRASSLMNFLPMMHGNMYLILPVHQKGSFINCPTTGSSIVRRILYGLERPLVCQAHMLRRLMLILVKKILILLWEKLLPMTICLRMAIRPSFIVIHMMGILASLRFSSMKVVFMIPHLVFIIPKYTGEIQMEMNIISYLYLKPKK